MKKVLAYFILIAVFSFSIFSFIGCDNNIEETYNKVTNNIEDTINPIKLSDKVNCKDVSIKFEAKYFVVTPTGFDFDELNKRGYNMRITVTYNVYYKKDYDVLWDIGYLGSPKYEISLRDTDGIGTDEANLTTSETKKNRSLSYSLPAINFKDAKIKLTFSSDNIQNIIYFENIVVSYNCYK